MQLAALNAAKLAKHAPHLRLICALAQAKQADCAIKLGRAERDLLELEDGRSYYRGVHVCHHLQACTSRVDASRGWVGDHSNSQPKPTHLKG